MAVASKAMGSPPEAGASIPLAFDASPELVALIDDLSQQLNTTPAEVFLRGVALLKLAVDAREEGKVVGAAEPGQPIEVEFVDY